MSSGIIKSIGNWFRNKTGQKEKESETHGLKDQKTSKESPPGIARENKLKAPGPKKQIKEPGKSKKQKPGSGLKAGKRAQDADWKVDIKNPVP